jgi:hypothetical protein
MYYATSNGQVMGVLNDFDLSIIEGIGRTESYDRTGTFPFMAYHLLESMTEQVPPPHIYGKLS